jgi:hypothetical protein
MNIPTQTQPTFPDTNTLRFMTVSTNVSLTEGLKKQDTSLIVYLMTADLDIQNMF